MEIIKGLYYGPEAGTEGRMAGCPIHTETSIRGTIASDNKVTKDSSSAGTVVNTTVDYANKD